MIERMKTSVEEFIEESNRIEGIYRDPTAPEILEFERFMAQDEITITDLETFISVYQPGAVIRDKQHLNVRVGGYRPPSGGMHIVYDLEKLLSRTAPEVEGLVAYKIHHWYESLHPFTDGNGRSGRMLWAWMMGEDNALARGFLHQWYYQSLSYSGTR